MIFFSGAEIQWPLSVLETPYFIGFFLKKRYESFFGKLESVRNRGVSVLERCRYREVRLYVYSERP